MEIQENETWSETESNGRRVGYSGPLSGPLVTSKKSSRNSSKRSGRFKAEDEYVEITLDVRDDSVLVQDIKGGDSETTYLASQLHKKKSASLGSQLSFRLKQVSQELKRMTSQKKPAQMVDRNKSCACRALKGLKFMTTNVDHEGWSQIEKRFHELAVDGTLPKSKFGQCIGTYTSIFAVNVLVRNSIFFVN